MTGICGWFLAFLFFLGAECICRCLVSLWFVLGAFAALYVLLWEWGQKNSCLFFSCHLWLHFCLSGPLHFWEDLLENFLQTEDFFTKTGKKVSSHGIKAGY